MTQALNVSYFTNDILRIIGSVGDTLVFNIVDEDFSASGVSIKINCVNIELIDGTTEARYICPNIIGLGTDRMRVFSDDVSLYGQQLTTDNIDKVKVELYERNR
jgi:hypothetical protein